MPYAKVLSNYVQLYMYACINGFEKRAHFTQNAKFPLTITWSHSEPYASVYRYPSPSTKEKFKAKKSSYLLIWSGGAPNWGIKQPISTACSTYNQNIQTRSGWDTKLTSSVFNNCHNYYILGIYYTLEVMKTKIWSFSQWHHITRWSKPWANQFLGGKWPPL